MKVSTQLNWQDFVDSTVTTHIFDEIAVGPTSPDAGVHFVRRGVDEESDRQDRKKVSSYL